MVAERLGTPFGARPRFSIVIPALDEERYIADCLRSLGDQDFAGEIEIIVVDNNSTDATAAVASALGATVVVEQRHGTRAR